MERRRQASRFRFHGQDRSDIYTGESRKTCTILNESQLNLLSFDYNKIKHKLRLKRVHLKVIRIN